VRLTTYRGYRLKYVDRGSGDAIVFVHNGSVSHRLWDYQLGYFERSHRVIAPDLLGLGASDRPDIRYTADDYVAQLTHLVDELGLDRFHVVGCCLGGSIALEFARRQPTRVETLTVITAATPKTISSGFLGLFEKISRPGSLLRRALVAGCETGPGRALMSRVFYRYQCGPQVLEDRAFRDHVSRLYWSKGQWRVFGNTSLEGLAVLDSFQKPDGFPPTLMMWGMRNAILTGRSGLQLARAIQPDRTEFWNDCGYMLMRERPTETNQVIEEFIANGRKQRPPTSAAVAAPSGPS